MIFNTSSSHDSFASNDRAFLEDSQRIIAVLIKNGVILQYFYDLLPERQLRKVQALALELERSLEVAKAKESAANFKGESCINTALFRPPEQIRPAVRDTDVSEDAESQRIMTEALSQGWNVNRQRKERIPRVIDNSRKTESTKNPINPYQRHALKESRKSNLLSITKGNGNEDTGKHRIDTAGEMPRSVASGPMDVIESCLEQVKSASFVKPLSKIERINVKIRAHVTKGMICSVCNESLKEVSYNAR